MRALAGLAPSRGKVLIAGKVTDISSPRKSVRSGVSYLPGDRHREGIFADLSVRENFSSRSQSADIVAGLVRRASEDARAEQAVDQFAVKTPTIETPVRSLSGGNQQKLVLSGVLATHPKILLVNEPTQGVDVGARAEIYKTLREAAKAGVAIIVVSSDAQEVAGFSDRVAILSRGRIVRMLSGAEVAEDNITGAALKSTSHREKDNKRAHPILAWAAGNTAPLVMVASAILLLGAAVTYYNPFYISTRNLMGIAAMIATLAIVAYGQQVLLLVGGIDLSVGPLMGLCMVVSSFFLVQAAGPLAAWFLIDHRAFRKYRLGYAKPAPVPYIKLITDGYLIRGRTLAELAAQIGADGAQLERTVAAFNPHAHSGQDPEFGKGSTAYNRSLGDPDNKPNPCVAPIERGPFYAVRLHIGDLGTFAGLKTNENAQVLNAEGRPIGGLYAAGNAAASIIGGNYPGGGITLGPAITFGYIAARHMSGANE